jgi:hypothetical protein
METLPGSSSGPSSHLTTELFCLPTMTTPRRILLFTIALASLASAENPAVQKQASSAASAQSPRLQTPRTVRQIGTIDLPGSPGFDDLAFAKGKLLVVHTAASSLDIVDPAKAARHRAGCEPAIAPGHCCRSAERKNLRSAVGE